MTTYIPRHIAEKHRNLMAAINEDFANGGPLGPDWGVRQLLADEDNTMSNVDNLKTTKVEDLPDGVIITKVDGTLTIYPNTEVHKYSRREHFEAGEMTRQAVTIDFTAHQDEDQTSSADVWKP